MDENAAAPATPGEAAPLNNTDTLISSTGENGQGPETPIFTPEQAQEIKAFFDNNGGFEKVKKNLTMRQADTQPQVQIPPANPLNDSTAQQPQPLAQPAQQPVPQPLKGGISQEEFMTFQYFQSLSQREEYKGIAEQMRNGDVIKEMAKFNIRPMINGQFNDAQVKEFLDLYAKTVPAQPADTPVTTTPTVEYVQVGETINNMNDAMRVLQQDQQLRAQGQPGHPMAKQANEFFDGVLNSNQNRGKVEHTTLEEAKKK